MKCERVRALLSDYLDGELSAAGMAGVQSHLRRCVACEGEHQALRRTVQLVALHGRQTVPVDCRDQVLARLRSGTREHGRVNRGIRGFLALHPFTPSPPLRRFAPVPFRSTWARAAAVAALALVCAGGRSLMVRQPSPDAPAAPRQVAVSAPREDYTRFHGPYQFGQAMGRDDGIILASDLIETP